MVLLYFVFVLFNMIHLFYCRSHVILFYSILIKRKDQASSIKTIPYFVHHSETKVKTLAPCSYGTGSCPCPPPGRHLEILLAVSNPPLKRPCFFIASMPYWLQVGVKRHEGGSNGESVHWYILMSNIPKLRPGRIMQF